MKNCNDHKTQFKSILNRDIKPVFTDCSVRGLNVNLSSVVR